MQSGKSLPEMKDLHSGQNWGIAEKASHKLPTEVKVRQEEEEENILNIF